MRRIVGAAVSTGGAGSASGERRRDNARAMAERVPPRLRTAVEVLDPAPDARVLEVGCGPGVALALVLQRLTGGHVTGLDRSASAVERARARIAGDIAAARADVQHGELASFGGAGQTYDAIFAVNVNVFWTGPAAAEALRLGALLAADGVVRLFYAAPSRAQEHRAGAGARAALERGGFFVETTSPGGTLCLTARRLARRPVR